MTQQEFQKVVLERFDIIDQKFDAIDGKFEEIHEKFEFFSVVLTKMESRFEKRFLALEKGQSNLKKEMKKIHGIHTVFSQTFTEHKSRITDLEKEVFV